MTRSQARRIVAASLIALIGLSGTTALGAWQYSRAHRDDIAKQVLAATARPVLELDAAGTYLPETAFAHRATVVGRALDARRALLSCDRHEHDANGCWVIAPLQVTTDLALTTVIGFATDTQADQVLAAVRALGMVRGDWSGRLQPSEVIDRGHAILRPSDRVRAINVNELAMRWRTQLLDGYLVLHAPKLQAKGLQYGRTSALVLPPAGITWRNLLYAWQWWAFAAFVLFLLTRYVIDVRNEPRTIAAPTQEEH